MILGALAGFALAAWLGVLLLPSRPWSTRERLTVRTGSADIGSTDLAAVAVLIPARNEADTIGETLAALGRQGQGLRVLVVDDESDDGTTEAARAAGVRFSQSLELECIAGRPLPAGWGGKLWALEQGLAEVDRDYCLLLDAEIQLAPGVIAALLHKALSEQRALVSVMATLRCATFWERLLVPPFIYFFKLLYPFDRINAPESRRAGAAGGCILIRTNVLREVGGFAAIRDALIDDCTLAARVKRAGYSIWLGLSEAVQSVRPYSDLASFRRMVSRTAFTQLGYSTVMLLLVVGLMLALFLAPPLALLVDPSGATGLVGLAALAAMAGVYWPTVKFYRLPYFWTLTLPVAAALFLGMTIESAVRYWRGVRAEWKGRTYSAW